MTSQARVDANRANARKSTGPRTTKGKALVSQNARRHGLNTPAANVDAFSQRIADWAKVLADGAPINGALWRLAVAYVDVERIEDTRLAILKEKQAEVSKDPGWADCEPGSSQAEALRRALTALRPIYTYERKARRRLQVAREAMKDDMSDAPKLQPHSRAGETKPMS